MPRRATDNDLTRLQQSIGFGTAFKATLGFYAAQFVATLLGFATIGLILGTIYWFVK